MNIKPLAFTAATIACAGALTLGAVGVANADTARPVDQSHAESATPAQQLGAAIAKDEALAQYDPTSGATTSAVTGWYHVQAFAAQLADEDNRPIVAIFDYDGATVAVESSWTHEGRSLTGESLFADTKAQAWSAAQHDFLVEWPSRVAEAEIVSITGTVTAPLRTEIPTAPGTN